MSATDVVATIAIVFSAVSLVLAWRESGRRDNEIGYLRRESERRDDEIGYLRRESERRDEELALLRQQAAAEEAERRRQRQAHISVRTGASGSSAQEIAFDLTVHNSGPHVADNVGVVVHDKDDVPIGQTVKVPRPLGAGEEQPVRVSTSPRDYYMGPYKVYAEWEDGRSYSKEPMGITLEWR